MTDVPWNKTLKTKFLQQCEYSIERFIRRVQPFKDTFQVTNRGIWVSEGFALCAACDLFDIDLYIESGLYKGQSAWIMGTYLVNGEVVSIEHSVLPESEKRLHSLPNVTIEKQNSIQFLANFVKRNSKKKIGIFLDGPKGQNAFNLAHFVVNSPNVRFVSIHDMYNDSPIDENSVRSEIEKNFITFATDDKDFVQSYKFLDEGQWEKSFMEKGKKEDGTSSASVIGRLNHIPYGTQDDSGTLKVIINSYGPTIIFMFNVRHLQLTEVREHLNE